MKLFTILAPRAVEAVAGPEGARATGTGFSFAGLAFGPLWLLFRGLWLALIGYAIIAAAVVALVSSGWLAPGAALALGALANLYVAVEGRALALGARIRSGRALVDIVLADTALEAEKVFLERALAAAPPAAYRGAPPSSPDVLGLFPEPSR